MRIAIIGSGGREHALCYRLSIEENVTQVDVLPGNPGMLYSSDKINIFPFPFPLPLENDFLPLIDFLKKRKIDLVIIGPEGPLSEGIVDKLEEAKLNVFGPSKEASQLESSKLFSKRFMKKFNISTAAFQSFSDEEQAYQELEKIDVESEGIVIKASSLADGKGVVVTKNREEAKKAIYDFLINPECSVKTEEILFEKLLTGKEVSAFGLLDGKTFKILGYACDHKRLKDQDLGPNTGGMGCYFSKKWPSLEQRKVIEEEIIGKTLTSMGDEQIPFKGFLFVGLMINDNQINVIEYNVRFGDPEAQTLLPLIKGSLSENLLAASKSDLENCTFPLNLSDKSSVHVVMTSKGYPSILGEEIDLGHEITFNSDLVAKEKDQSLCLFFAGVKKKNNSLVNSGGRVLGVTAIFETLEGAKERAYQEIQKIHFEGAFYRKDIGHK